MSLLDKVFFGLVFLTAGVASANDGSGSPRADAIQLHEKMAKLHNEAADCLKAGKPMDECRQAMLKSCPKGEIPQCSALTAEDLRRHSKTHEMGGIKAPG